MDSSKTVMFLLLFACPVGAATMPRVQCQSGNGFAYCPSEHVVYLVSQSEQSVRAIDTLDKRIRWQTKLSDAHVASYPTATPEAFALATGAIPSNIEAFDTSTGHPAWKLESKTTDVMSAGSYIIANTNESEGLMAIDSVTGRVAWRHTGKTRSYIHFFASSARALLTNLFAIDARTGRVLRRWRTSEQVSAAAFAGNIQVVGTPGGELVAYSGRDYKLLWSKHIPNSKDVVIAATADHLLAVNYDAYFFRAGRAKLTVLSPSSGEMIWQNEITIDGKALPNSAAISNGLVLFVKRDAGDKSSVVAFDIASGAEKWIVPSNVPLGVRLICDENHCYVGTSTEDIFVIDLQAGTGSLMLSDVK